MILLPFVVLGIIIGLFSGGSFAGFARGALRFRWLPLVFIALGAQAVIFTGIAGRREVVHDIGPYIYIASLGLLLAFMLRNLHIPGMWIILLGTLLNAAVITANGGFMPAPESALREAGRVHHVEDDAGGRAEILSNSKIADDGTNLRFLGDVFYIPDPYPFHNVFSIGDLVIGIGATYAVATVLRRGKHTERSTRNEEQIAAG